MSKPEYEEEKVCSLCNDIITYCDMCGEEFQEGDTSYCFETDHFCSFEYYEEHLKDNNCPDEGTVEAIMVCTICDSYKDDCECDKK